MIVELKLEGAKELKQFLDTAPRRVAQSIVKKSMRRAMVPMRDQVRANIRSYAYDTGAFWRSVVLRAARRIRGTSSAVATVLVDRARLARYGKPQESDEFYPAYIEYGTPTQPARPIFRPAFDETRAETERIFNVEVFAEIDRQAANLNKSTR